MGFEWNEKEYKDKQKAKNMDPVRIQAPIEHKRNLNQIGNDDSTKEVITRPVIEKKISKNLLNSKNKNKKNILQLVTISGSQKKSAYHIPRNNMGLNATVIWFQLEILVFKVKNVIWYKLMKFEPPKIKQKWIHCLMGVLIIVI